MKKNLLLFALLLPFVAAPTAAAGNELMIRAQSMFKPIPDKAPVLSSNPATPEKLELGRILYFDPRLSASQLISCNTCHNVGMGGIDFQETSIGHQWQKGPRNSPTVLNAVFNIAQFWDGRAQDLKEQAKGPLVAAIEMGNKPEEIIKTVKSMPGYMELFRKTFPGEAEPVTLDNIVKAIEIFEAALITPDA